MFIMNRWIVIRLFIIFFFSNVITCKASITGKNVKSFEKDAKGFYLFRPSTTTSGHYHRAAVATNSKQCANSGIKILKKGGSAVDAAIATLLCDGILNAQSMGIGGGFLMTIWDAKEKKAYFLNAREYAPSAAKERTFSTSNNDDSFRGGKAIAVPGEIAGYWKAHKRFGKLPWASLFEDAIKICEEGPPVSRYVSNIVKGIKSDLKKYKSLSSILMSKTNRSRYAEAGERFVPRLKLAETLKKLRDQGKDVFYKGEIAQKLVKDIRRAGGIITLNDFKNYKAQWKKPVKSKIGKMVMYSAPLPGSGPILAFVLNILKNLVPTARNKYIFWQRIAETLKWAFARKYELGDFTQRLKYKHKFSEKNCLMNNLTIYKKHFSYEIIEKNGLKWDKDCLVAIRVKRLLNENYAKEVAALIEDNKTFNNYEHYNITREGVNDGGTAHTCVYAKDGSAVAVTSTINYPYGSYIHSQSTGIILNNQMSDYAYPSTNGVNRIQPPEFNFIRNSSSKLRPLSSMSPTIILNKDKGVRLVIGSAGGPKIISGVTIGIVLNLLKGLSIKAALDYPRIHVNPLSMTLERESNFDPKIDKYLKRIGHRTKLFEYGNSMSAIAVYGPNNISASGDYRREGGTAGY